jgi:ATP-dependent protease ClpP protease subunit/phage major head subunit gpT-like protein
MDEESDGLTVGGDIVLYGTVGGDWFGEGFTAAQVVRALAGKGDVTVRLNSGGGSAFDGAAIYAVLSSHPGQVTVVVEGIAASAASLVAMGGDVIEIADGAMLMVHDPAMWVSSGRGTADDHRRDADMLDKLAGTYAAVYAKRTKTKPDEARAVMRAETWMGADDAVSMGYADRKSGKPAAEASAFDFTLYDHAPDHLRVLAQARGWKAPASGTAATLTGARGPELLTPVNSKEPVMATENQPVAETAPDIKAPVAPTMAAPSADAIKAAVEAERTRAADIRAAVAKAKVSPELADTLIAEGVSMDVARARIIDAWADAGDRHEYAPRPAEPKVTRMDEKQTLRDGIVEAMAVQMKASVDKPSEKARPFMECRTLPAMAAAYMGHRGPLDTFAARSDVLMAAFHTTSDFPALLENVLNKSLVARYREAAPTYRRIARQMSFADFRPHPMVKMGDFPEMSEIAENGEIKFGTFGDSKETVAVKSYAVGAKLSRQVLVNDTLGGIQQALADRGRAVARFEDKVFYTMMLSGANADGPTLLETTRQVFNTTDGTKDSASSAISVTSLSKGRAAMRKKTSVGGDALLDVSAAILLVGPDKETEAQQVVAPIQAQQAGNVNPFSGSLEVVTTARIAGNTWYMFADPADVPCFIYGFLDGFEAPRVRIEEPFGMQGAALTIEHDFGVGAVDFRGGWKNVGA